MLLKRIPPASIWLSVCQSVSLSLAVLRLLSLSVCLLVIWYFVMTYDCLTDVCSCLRLPSWVGSFVSWWRQPTPPPLLRPNYLGVFVCKPVKIEHGCCFMFLCKDVPEFEHGVTGVCIVLPLKVMVRFYLFLLLSRLFYLLLAVSLTREYDYYFGLFCT